MKNPLLWSIAAIAIGVIIVIISIAADAATGSNWWHIGTASGAFLAAYGVKTAVFDRRGPEKRP